jgi:hypothetical protein
MRTVVAADAEDAAQRARQRRRERGSRGPEGGGSPLPSTSARMSGSAPRSLSGSASGVTSRPSGDTVPA